VVIMAEYTWVIQLIVGGILSILCWSLKGNFTTLTSSVKKVSESVANISNKMAVFEVHMENTNKHIEAIIRKMDKVEEHSEKLAVIQSQLLQVPEIDNRFRDVEYAKRAANS